MGSLMHVLKPNQASFIRSAGRVQLLLSTDGEFQPAESKTEFRLGTFLVEAAGINVAVVSVSVRLISAGKAHLFAGWIDELDPVGGGILESLATQAELPVLITKPPGAVIGHSIVGNSLKPLAQQQLAIVAAAAEKSPWRPEQFDEARKKVERQFIEAAQKWSDPCSA